MSNQSPLRIAIGALLFEGNTLSPLKNGLQDFQNKYYASDAEMLALLRGGQVEMSGAIATLEAEPEVELVPLFATHGGAGGRVSAEAHGILRENLLAPLRGAGPLDGIYLALHGAMVCEGTDDAEGDLLEQVRTIAGRVPLAISLDLHAHVTQKMLALSDLLIGYQHYPHDDGFETGERCAQLLLRTVRREIAPLMRMRQAPMIIPSPNTRTSGSGPMADFNRWARQQEGTGRALAISYFPTQPWLDLPEVGCSAVVITDGDEKSARSLATELAGMFWRRRAEFEVPLVPPAEAIRRGMALAGAPVILTDTADCVGGGGSGDSALVLQALLDSPLDEPATMLIVDPETVAQAQRVGSGASFAARLGNKQNPIYGSPVEAEATVLRLFEGRFSYSGGILAGGSATMGPSALLRVGPVQLVVSSYSSYEYADEQFRAAGVDPGQCKFVVVKNPMNYQAAYEGAAAMMVLDTPGPTTCNLAGVDWQRITRPRYPLDLDFSPEGL